MVALMDVSELSVNEPSASPGRIGEVLKEQDRESARKAIAARVLRNGDAGVPVDLTYQVKEGERVEPITPTLPRPRNLQTLNLAPSRRRSARSLSSAPAGHWPRTAATTRRVVSSTIFSERTAASPGGSSSDREENARFDKAQSRL
jgi:hypothetical protein